MLDDASQGGAVEMTSALRRAGIRAAAYPSVAKLKKQMKYAADLKVDFVLMAGEEERSNDLWTVRQMETGNQQQLSIAAAVECVLDQCG
jgi:histidyl-tRNA synthetase